MTSENPNQELLEFFKALADASRLKIIGLLAQRESNVESLADQLALSVSTVSHHLSMLSHAGLVSAKVDGHYYYYRLETDHLRGMAQRLLADEALPRLSGPIDGDVFEKKVMAAFVDAAGHIKAFPGQEKKFIVLLRHVARSFEPGVRYSEKQVNEIMLRFNDDTASLRRGMIEYHIMERAGGGGDYWLA